MPEDPTKQQLAAQKVQKAQSAPRLSKGKKPGSGGEGLTGRKRGRARRVAASRAREALAAIPEDNEYQPSSTLSPCFEEGKGRMRLLPVWQTVVIMLSAVKVDASKLNLRGILLFGPAYIS